MKILRWILFIPIAFIASLVAGAIGHYLARFAGAIFVDDTLFISWLLSGFASAFIFVLVGIKVAPEKTNAVKFMLATIIVILGAISAIGSYFGGENQSASIAGIVMVLVAIGVFRTETKNLEIL